MEEIYGIDYYNNILDYYLITESGKYDKVKLMELVPLNETKEIEVYEYDGSKENVTLDENTKVLYKNGDIVGYALPNKAYGVSLDYGVCVELKQLSGFSESQKVAEKDGNLYELVKNGEVKLGTIITGYEANGYSGEWMIYKIEGENVKILPYHENWDVKYQYQPEIGNEENLNNVKEECKKYYNEEFAVGEKGEMFTLAEFKAEYKPDNKHMYEYLAAEGYMYVIGDDESLKIANNSSYYWGGLELNSAVEYTIIPVITLDKDVKITAGEYTGRIYK